MATAGTQHGASKAPPETFDVTLRMVLEDPIDRAALEDLAVAINEVIDTHTGDEVGGASVSGGFAPPAIEVGLDIVARSMSELHEILASILAVIERECPVTVVMGDTHVERAEDGKRDLVCA